MNKIMRHVIPLAIEDVKSETDDSRYSFIDGLAPRQSPRGEYRSPRVKPHLVFEPLQYASRILKCNGYIKIMLASVSLFLSITVYATRTYECPLPGAIVITQNPSGSRPYGYEGIVVVNDYKQRGLIAKGRGKSGNPAKAFYGSFVDANGLLVCGYTKKTGGTDPTVVISTLRSILNPNQSCVLDGQKLPERSTPCTGSIATCAVVCTAIS